MPLAIGHIARINLFFHNSNLPELLTIAYFSNSLLDNSDSMRKLRLAQLWTSKAGNNYRYFMVFDNSPIENAHKLDDVTKLIAQM